MKFKKLKPRPELGENSKLEKAYAQFEKLLDELTKKKLPEEMVHSINNEIEALNAITDSGKLLKKAITKRQSGIIRLIEKKLKIVPRNYYRNMWLALGMAVFGIPLGVALGTSLGNMAFLSIGLPIGMAIGIGVGTSMDQKAAREGRQLDLEIEV